MEILLVLAVGAMCIGCFLVGAKVGQSVAKGEPVELPNIDPFKAYKERKNKEISEKEQKKLDTILTNIESYNGTGYNQKDVP